MSNEPVGHPDLEQLAALDGGRLSSGQMTTVERHVAACDVCCRRLQTLPEDGFTALVRAFAGGAPTGLEAPGGATAGLEVPAALVGHPRYRVLEEVGQG